VNAPPSRRLALLAAETLDAKKAEDVVVLDLRAHTLVADYFVIASAQSLVQIRAVSEAVEETLAGAGGRLLGREGHARARWVLLDFGPVVVHIFGPDARRLYSLERLWADAPIVEW
jgi:ribosome-associated protein